MSNAWHSDTPRCLFFLILMLCLCHTFYWLFWPRSKIIFQLQHAQRWQAFAATSATLNLIWFIFFESMRFSRHFYFGWMSVLLYLCLGTISNVSVLRAASIFVVMLLLLVGARPQLSFVSNQNQENRLSALHEGVDFLKVYPTATIFESVRPDRQALIGCGWWVSRELEFLLPGSGNFRNGNNLSDETLASGRYILAKSDNFDLKDPACIHLNNHCPDDVSLFKNKVLTLSTCH